MSATWNNSSNEHDDELKEYALPVVLTLSVVLSVVIAATILGNALVILAIAFERHLHRPQNYLITSLAVADLMIGIFVLPFSAMYEIKHNRWELGVLLCDFWSSLDVLMCTASILHLVAIAIDRYWSITDVVYSQHRTPKRICFMIFVVWMVALTISVGPILGWKDADYDERVNEKHLCLISQEVSYQIYATTTAFWIPLIMIIVLYYKIYMAARSRLRRRLRGNPEKSSLSKNKAHENGEVNSDSGGEGDANSLDLTCNGDETPQFCSKIIKSHLDNVSLTSTSSRAKKSLESTDSERIKSSKALLRTEEKNKRKLEARRERKAFTTLAIVTGSFLCSWLPFFVLALLRPLCAACSLGKVVDSVVMWLGYLNSLQNPVIYTIFSPDFRNAFKRLLGIKLCRCS